MFGYGRYFFVVAKNKHYAKATVAKGQNIENKIGGVCVFGGKT